MMNLILILSALTLTVGAHSSGYETLQQVSNFADGRETIVISDQSTTPNGIYVATGETYYSIYSPLLLQIGWTSVSVNENNISVLLEKGIFFFSTFSALSKKKRELITDIRSKFLSSVTGLTLGNSFPHKDFSRKPYENLPGFSNNNYGPVNSYSIGESSTTSQLVYKSYGQNNAPSYSCAPSNYYNLIDSPLSKTLRGDVYLLDFRGNILDVYSNSVSILRKPGRSILYRDHRYFVYHRSNMPLLINRVILIGQHIIFVYNDLNVLAKASWQLNSVELELVITARNEIKKLSELQILSAKVNAASEEGKAIEKEELKEELIDKVSQKVPENDDEFFEPLGKQVEVEKPVEDVKLVKDVKLVEEVKLVEDKKQVEEVKPIEDGIGEKKGPLEDINDKGGKVLVEKKESIGNTNPLTEKLTKKEEIIVTEKIEN